MTRHFLAYACGALLVACATPPGSQVAPQYTVEVLVPGTSLHGIQGLAWGGDGQLYAAAMASQQVSRIDPKTGAVEVVIDAPDGESDDVDLGPDGTLAWTAMLSGELRIQRPGGPVEVLADGLPWLNPITFSPDGRLFGVTLGDPNRLWEFYLDGTTPPRLVSDRIGGLNSFEISEDGYIYGPYWRDGDLVRIDINTGEVAVLASGVGSPTAVELDSQGRLISVDFMTGDVRRTDPVSGESIILAALEAPLDNLAVGPDDTIYVAESARSGIAVVSPDGTVQEQLTGGAFSTPGGLDMVNIGGRELILVADPLGYKFADPVDGSIASVPYNMEYGHATDVGASDKIMALTNARGGSLQIIDTQTRELLSHSANYDAPYGVTVLPDSDVLFVEYGAGTLVRWSQGGSKIIAKGLRGPVGLVLESDTTVLIAEHTAGALSRVNIATGEIERLHDGLSGPEGLDIDKDGRIVVAEVGRRRIVVLDLGNGAESVIADDLNLGVMALRAPPEVGLPTGVAVGMDGAIYVSEDGANGILKITTK